MKVIGVTSGPPKQSGSGYRTRLAVEQDYIRVVLMPILSTLFGSDFDFLRARFLVLSLAQDDLVDRVSLPSEVAQEDEARLQLRGEQRNWRVIRERKHTRVPASES